MSEGPTHTLSANPAPLNYKGQDVNLEVRTVRLAGVERWLAIFAAGGTFGAFLIDLANALVDLVRWWMGT